MLGGVTNKGVYVSLFIVLFIVSHLVTFITYIYNLHTQSFRVFCCNNQCLWHQISFYYLFIFFYYLFFHSFECVFVLINNTISHFYLSKPKAQFT